MLKERFEIGKEGNEKRRRTQEETKDQEGRKKRRGTRERGRSSEKKRR